MRTFIVQISDEDFANADAETRADIIRSEIVRCGECKHMIADGRCMEFADDGIRPSAADFCSYGERREDGEA